MAYRQKAPSCDPLRCKTIWIIKCLDYVASFVKYKGTSQYLSLFYVLKDTIDKNRFNSLIYG